ncbi:uncharacterized protein F5891DRAFT_1021493 [Suillus fuscotomentosus]|uniref:Response regulatory domain-containing protein n=1 Tax=Suillus fuscotomentosus TaxID=1912939 RepID=A0AAD4EAU0_9AGAM|nr:uncharacterized protein F5891DRAFT_1021493 [Suillus fuscotomentosus]KAG1902873.1 hypothetical protein F5891DRAFT_1021493 [Suillus fuscotomentosus]
MSGAKPILAHRLPVSVLVNEEGLIAPEAIGPSKFAVTWSAEPPPPVLAPLVQAAERQVVLSSSDGESDFSEKDLCSLGEKQSPAELSDEFESSLSQRFRPQQLAPHHHDENPIIPRLSRATSMPLPSQLEHLKNPRRTTSTSPEVPSQPLPTDATAESSRFHELSLELADSVQMVVQTLLQVSPTQILDPAKEQFAACSLSVPTACMSAVFTTMKNLNYISANMPDLCADTFNPAHSSNSTLTARRLTLPGPPVTPATDFDIGEMLQGVGDASSGRAAEVGVDLVLFHSDVGMRHIAVKGVECGISNVLTHVVRQIINTARRGDSIDLGLSIASSSYLGSNMSPSIEKPSSTARGVSSPVPIDEDETLQCTFEIHHRFHSPDVPVDDMTPTNTNPSDVLERPEPNFGSMLFRRLLLRCGASLSSDVTDDITSRRTYEVKLDLQRGSADTITAKSSATSEQSHVLLSGVRLGTEPSLEELGQFAETLRGKKVTLYASSTSSFAHHLTSYLTAWGLDVSHVSPEAEVDGTPVANEAPAPPSRERGSQEPRAPSTNGTPRLAPSLSFVMIDDDVSILRERLRKYRAEQPIPLSLHSRKRPSLAAHHRPKSSPQVARTLGLGSQALPQQTPIVVVHFTSLANYKLVKEIIQYDLASHSYPACPPEVMIIPKPAGPRRFLTALHTAVTKPIVDPFFAPIATSPLSPGSHSSPFFNLTQTSPKSPSSRPSNSSRTNSERSMRSTRDSTSEHHSHAPPSPLGLADNMEYFPETQSPVRLGQTPSSGLVISSPDGQPTGIIFQPRAKSTKPITPSPNSVAVDRDKPQFLLASSERLRGSSRRLSESEQKKQGQSPLSFASLHSNVLRSVSPPRREASPIEGFTPISTTPKAKGKGVTSPQADELTPSSPLSPPSRNASTVDLRKVSSPPSSPVIPEPQPSVLTRRPGRRATHDSKPSTPPTALGKAGKGQPDTSIIPPISVLIVDDNPINQTILSTFMRRKKIKYDVAKNGEEAVQKWQNGGFHLILMDIQMPVMDGIQATKEIRRLESLTASSGYTPGTPLSDTLSDGAFSESRASASPYRSAVIIVALTASSLQSDRVAALAAGCNDFLTKPVSLEWLNNKIIEWGSIKALQMWADLRPEVVKTISTEQTAQAQLVARRLHVPEGRMTPIGSLSRSTSKARGEKSDPPVQPGPELTAKLAEPKGVDETTSKPANDLPDNDSPGSSPSSESSDSFEQSGEKSASLPAAHNNDTDDAVTQSESMTAKDEHTPTDGEECHESSSETSYATASETSTNASEFQDAPTSPQ